MAATLFGSGAFGIASAETGMLIQSISYSYPQEKKQVKDHSGCTVGVAYYDEQVEVKLAGVIPTTSAFSGTLAATLTLANAFPDHLKGSATGGSLIVEEVNIEHSAEDYRTIEVTARYYPQISAS